MENVEDNVYFGEILLHFGVERVLQGLIEALPKIQPVGFNAKMPRDVENDLRIDLYVALGNYRANRDWAEIRDNGEG